MRRIKTAWLLFLNLPFTLLFNFKYLPFKQAIKLPILLFRPSLKKLKGKVVIKSDQIKFGMIVLGQNMVSIYPNNGVLFENNGGTVEFVGRCILGNNTSISVGEKGKLVFGDDFLATCGAKIVCYHYVNFGDRTRFGWNVLVMDTGFHPLKYVETGEFTGKAYGPIITGKNNWFANGVLIMKNTITPDYCIFGARSVLSKKIKAEPYSVLVGTPPKVIATGVYRDVNDCTETYEEYIPK